MRFKFIKIRKKISFPQQPIVKNINWLNIWYVIKFKSNELRKNSFLVFFFLLLLCWAILQFWRFSAIANNLKQQIFKRADLVAKQFNQTPNLSNIQELIGEIQSTEALLNEILRLNAEFSNATLHLSKLSQKTQLLEQFSKIGLYLTASGKNLITLKYYLEPVSFQAYGIENFENLKFIRSELSQLLTNLESANRILQNSRWQKISPEYTPKLEPLGQILVKSETKVKQLTQIAELAEYFFDGQKNILILLQNQNELRATGGFIGSFANFKINRGKVEKIKLTSVYDIDGQLTEKIVPPEPLLAVNNRWYLRDANWFADYPQSAKKLIEFFEKEGGETPDFVMALTPHLIADLISLTGPITVENQTQITAENLIERLQVLTQQNLLAVQNEPKKILSGLMDSLFNRLETLPLEQKSQLPAIFLKNLQSKHLLIYANQNPTAQKILENFNWSGQLHSTDKDFLYVNVSNLNGSKTDWYITQELNLLTTIDKQGKIINSLTLKRKNPLPKNPNTTSQVYVRVFVPKGSKFIEAEGFTPIDLPKLNLPDYTKDHDVQIWEKALLRNVSTGTTIGEEANYTFFANWLETQAQMETIAKFTYELPFQVKKDLSYSLLVQKQPGTSDQTFTHSLITPYKQPIWHNLPSPQINPDQINYQTLLNKDLIFGILFKGDDTKN